MKTRFKALAFLTIMAVFIPMSLSAQKSDGFFKSGNDGYQDRETFVINGNSEGGLSNYGIGETVPVGSGLLIMLTAGAGYAVLRRKKAVRKGVTLLLALTMVLSFTQCKKKLDTINPTDQQMVNITLDVSGGSRVNVDPYWEPNATFAKVTYENGDKVYAVYKGNYLTTLTYNSSTLKFEGTMPSPAPEPDYYSPIWFYFLGGNGFTAVEESTNVYSVDISDQTENYPIISCAHSDEVYKGTGSYTAKLQNKCSIVKFNDNAPAGKVLCITGMNNKVTVDFSTGDFEYSQINNGIIRMPVADTDHDEGGRHVRWAICLPQDDVTTAGSAKSIYTRGRAEVGTRPSFGGTIGENQYLDGKSGKIGNIALTFEDNDAPEGAIDFAYSVASDKQVYFSKGNLQYTRMSTSDDWSTGTWSFMNHQYDVVETGNVSDNYANETAIGLFGWGCTGIMDTRSIIANPTYAVNIYNPNNTIAGSSSMIGNAFVYYGPVIEGDGDGWVDDEDVDATFDLSVENHSDWGYCYDNNNENTKWFTLSSDEWRYLVNRTNAGHKLRGLVTISDITNGIIVIGLMLLPDNSDALFNNDLNDFTDNVYNLTQWQSMEDLGAVLLTQSSYYRRGAQLYSHRNKGSYWSRDYCRVDDDGDDLDLDYRVISAWAFQIFKYDGENNFVNSWNIYCWDRYMGCSVRLVYDITSK